RVAVRRASELAAHQRCDRGRAGKRHAGRHAQPVTAASRRPDTAARRARMNPQAARSMATEPSLVELEARDRGAASTSGNEAIEAALGRRYEAGFVTDIESESLPPGLDESVVREISARKGEPEWMAEWRVAAY